MSERFVVCYMRDLDHVETTNALGVLFVDAETMFDALEIAAEAIPGEGRGIGTLLTATPLEGVKIFSPRRGSKEKAMKFEIQADKMSNTELADLLMKDSLSKGQNGQYDAATIVKEAAKRLQEKS